MRISDGSSDVCSSDLAYPTVEYRAGTVVHGAPAGDGFVLSLDGGDQVTTRRVLLATGMQYCPPELPGLEPLWEIGTAQCRERVCQYVYDSVAAGCFNQYNQA